jgi:anti-anti-sigma factor
MTRSDTDGEREPGRNGHTALPDAGLAIRVRRVDGRVVVTATGEVDLSTAAQFEQEISHALAGHTSRLILNLSQLAFMDATGLRVLGSAQEQARRHGVAFQVVAGRGQSRQLLELSGLLEEFDIVPS